MAIYISHCTKVFELSKLLEILDKSALLLPLHYFSFYICSLLKSVNGYQKTIFELCKLYSVYEKVPEEFLDETDVDSYFNHNILNISLSHH